MYLLLYRSFSSFLYWQTMKEGATQKIKLERNPSRQAAEVNTRQETIVWTAKLSLNSKEPIMQEAFKSSDVTGSRVAMVSVNRFSLLGSAKHQSHFRD